MTKEEKIRFRGEMETRTHVSAPVVRPVPEKTPEELAAIAFHNYYISSDRDGGLKDIVVEAGACVTYTAHKNASLCDSDWTVNGKTENNTSRIVFNRNWWDVPSWFIPSMDTPKPGVYNINAHDVQHNTRTSKVLMHAIKLEFLGKGIRILLGPLRIIM